MILNDVKIIKRIPTEQYGFYEVEVTGTFEDGDDVIEEVAKLKEQLEGKVREEEPKEEVKKKVTKKKKTATTKKKKVVKEEEDKESKEDEERRLSYVGRENDDLDYSRRKEDHKQEFINILATYDANWNKDPKKIKRAKEVSLAMVGKRMFKPNGEIERDFVAETITLLEESWN